jgi:hypothetical protein
MIHAMDSMEAKYGHLLQHTICWPDLLTIKFVAHFATKKLFDPMSELVSSQCHATAVLARLRTARRRDAGF